jgi:putative hydrolase of the HAD superfamily
VAAPPLVLFDLDDTLCDYSGARTGRLRGAYGDAFLAAGERDIDLDAVIAESIAIHPHGSDHFPDILARHGVDDPELALRARRWYQQNRFLGLGLFPDARELLHLVRSVPSVRKIGLITNGPAEVQREKIALLELWDEIDFAVISGEVGVEKPDPRIFARALAIAGMSADEAIYIGDSPEYDMDGAHNAGIARIWVNRAREPWPLPTPPPEHEADSLSAVFRLLSAL